MPERRVIRCLGALSASALMMSLGITAFLAAPRAAAASTASSWPTFHGDSGVSGVSTDSTISNSNATQLGLHWMAPVGSAVDSSPVTDYITSTSTTLAYIATTGGALEAIDTSNGSIAWSDYFGVPILATPTVYNHSVWMGTFVSGRMYKIDTATGVVQCQFSLGTGTDLSSPTVATPPGGSPTLYFGVQDNGVTSTPIMAVDVATCKVDWSAVPYAQESGSWNPTSFGVDANGKALVLAGSANPDSTAYALDAQTGKLVWSNRNLSPTANDVGAGLTVSSPGQNGISDGMAYYPGEDGVLYALDLTTGKRQWTFDFRHATTSSPFKGGRSAAALTGRTLVFGTGTGVMAVDAVLGTEIWDSAKTVAPDTEIISSPLITGPPGHQVVVYGDMNGAVKVLDVATGAQLYSFQTHGYIMSSPADVKGTILIGSSDGFLYSFDLGGTNSSTYPSTTIVSPADGSTLKNPNSATSTTAPIALAGTGTTEHSAGMVLVAIQQNSATGPWWNGASATWQPGLTWNQVGVTPSTATSGTWSLSVPVARAGAVWQIFARAADTDGEVDRSGASSTVTIQPVFTGPRIHTSVSSAGDKSQLFVFGAGYQPGETVQISLPGYTLATATAGSTGGVSNTRITVPARFPYGVAAITGLGESSNMSSTTPLDVTSPWPQLGQGPAKTGIQATDTVLASVEVPDKLYRYVPSLVFDTGAPIASSPAIANKIAYVGNNAGNVDAVNAATGALVWKATTGGAVTSSPALDLQAKLVIVGSSDDNVYALNMSDGSVAWKRATGGPVNSSPTLVGSSVYVGSNDGHLYALSAITGSVLWTASMSGPVVSSPAVDVANGMLVVGDDGGDVSAFSTTGSTAGTEMWSVKTLGPVEDAPAIQGGLVFVGSSDGHEYALTESTGASHWIVNLGGSPASTAALAGGVLYVASSTGFLEALSPTDGSLQWEYQTQSAVTGVSASAGIIFTESSGGLVSAFRPRGENVWLAQTGAGLSGTAAICDNAVIVGAGDTGLYVYTPFGLPLQ